MIAAVAHDINHPGTNNAYEGKLNTEWSKLAEGDSTLEKMHTRYLFDIMRSEKALYFENHSENPMLTKELITRSILSTDITRHFSNLEKLQALLHSKKFDKTDYDHRYVKNVRI